MKNWILPAAFLIVSLVLVQMPLAYEIHLFRYDSGEPGWIVPPDPYIDQVAIYITPDIEGKYLIAGGAAAAASKGESTIYFVEDEDGIPGEVFAGPFVLQVTEPCDPNEMRTWPRLNIIDEKIFWQGNFWVVTDVDFGNPDMWVDNGFGDRHTYYYAMGGWCESFYDALSVVALVTR